MDFRLLDELEAILGYAFGDRHCLMTALTSKGYAQESLQRGISCEHQGFNCLLGDAVLKLSLINLLKQLGGRSQGKISVWKNDLESRDFIAQLPMALAIVKFMRLGVGERKQQINRQVNVIAETFEAVVGAIYEDGGEQAAKAFIDRCYQPWLE